MKIEYAELRRRASAHRSIIVAPPKYDLLSTAETLVKDPDAISPIDGYWIWTCRVCGKAIHSKAGETFSIFQNRVWDNHTVVHAKEDGFVPPKLG